MNKPAPLLAIALCGGFGSAHAASFLAFAPDPARVGAPASAAGDCVIEPGLARGILGGSAAGSPCHAGAWGATSPVVFAGDWSLRADSSASFTTAALPADLPLAGTATIAFTHRTPDSTTGVPAAYNAPVFRYALADVAPDGTETTIVYGSGGLDYSDEDTPHRSAAQFGVPAYVVPAGHRLAVRLTSDNAPETLLYFGGEYADSGVTLETQDDGSTRALRGIAAGALSPLTLLLSLLAAGLRRRT